ncbi:MAG: DUF4340 domain-containing protein [Bacteroidales bacterium]|nr:DUF4340 domain-containing protein [Bacteroidales bacterium]
MFRKINFRSLLAVIIALVLIVLVIKYFDSKNGERTFKSELVSIDTSKVSLIKIIHRLKENELILVKKNTTWKLRIENKEVNADEEAVQNILSELIKLKPKRVAATAKEKWEDYEVTDSLSTRVIVEEDGKVVSDLLIGKFDYKQDPMTRRTQMTSFVRLTEENEVYAVDGFLSMTFNRDANTFRNKTIIKSNKEDWTKLTFSYPADSSFVVLKQNNKWMLNGLITDSTETANYFNSVSMLTSYDFIDDVNENSLIQPEFSLTIEGNNFNPVKVNAFIADTVNQYIITTSLNEEAYFSGTKSNLFEKIFISRDKLKLK